MRGFRRRVLQAGLLAVGLAVVAAVFRSHLAPGLVIGVLGMSFLC